jgi:hypothetical protein
MVVGHVVDAVHESDLGKLPVVEETEEVGEFPRPLVIGVPAERPAEVGAVAVGTPGDARRVEGVEDRRRRRQRVSGAGGLHAVGGAEEEEVAVREGPTPRERVDASGSAAGSDGQAPPSPIEPSPAVLPSSGMSAPPSRIGW